MNLKGSVVKKFSRLEKRVWKQFYAIFRDEIGVLKDLYPALTKDLVDVIAHNCAACVIWELNDAFRANAMKEKKKK